MKALRFEAQIYFHTRIVRKNGHRCKLCFKVKEHRKNTNTKANTNVNINTNTNTTSKGTNHNYVNSTKEKKVIQPKSKEQLQSDEMESKQTGILEYISLRHIV